MSYRVLLLTTIQCADCGNETTYAHESDPVPIDQEPPWPDIGFCPVCGEAYPDDLGAATTEVAEGERVAPVTEGK